MLPNMVLNSVINNETEFPPFALMRALSALCVQLGEPEHPQLVHALRIWFTFGCYKKLPPAFLCDVHDMMDQYDRWHEDNDSDESTPYVPLYELLPMGYCIQSIHGHFLYDFHGLAPEILGVLRQQLRKNDADAYGLSVYHRSKTKVPLPEELDWQPFAFVEKFLRGTPFYDFFNTQVPFRIPRKTFASHGIILAPPNHGKTQLLGSLITGFLSEENPVGCFVLDPHGDLYNILRYRVAPNRLVCLDPDTNPPPLNFFDFGNSTEAQTLQTFSYLMSSLSGGLSDKQGAIVPYLLKLLRKIPSASLESLRQIVDEKVKSPEKSEFAAYIASLPQVDQGFFHNQFYNARMQETKDAIGWKLYSALSSDAFRQMFSAKENSINFDQLIADRKVVVVKGGFDSLGEEGMRVFLQFLVAQYYAAGMRRLRLPESKRHLCIMFVDEASHVLNTPIIARCLVDLRKVACSFVAATQVWDQIGSEVKSAVLGATAIKVCGPIQHNDAMVLSREMYCEHTFIRNMKAVEHSHADWAFYVSGMTDKAVKVRVPYGALETMPRINQSREALSFDSDDEDFEELLAEFLREEEEVPSNERQPEHERDYAKEEQEDFDACYERAMNELTAEAKASEPTIKPGRDWSEPT